MLCNCWCSSTCIEPVSNCWFYLDVAHADTHNPPSWADILQPESAVWIYGIWSQADALTQATAQQVAAKAAAETKTSCGSCGLRKWCTGLLHWPFSIFLRQWQGVFDCSFRLVLFLEFGTASFCCIGRLIWPLSACPKLRLRLTLLSLW